MDAIRQFGKKIMHQVAKWLNSVSGGYITPNQVTMASLVLHLPIFFALIAGYDWLAALMIIVFGLLDSVDGALARIQGRESKAGMLLDASTDRMKESLIFIALAYRFAILGDSWAVLATVVAITGSMSVSYIKAKGETALIGTKLDVQKINRVFQAGLMRYEIRMAVLVLGLLIGRVKIAVAIIAVLAWLTAFYRLIKIHSSISE